MSIISTRGHQMFPVLDDGQIETAKRFASGRAGVFAIGDVRSGSTKRVAAAVGEGTAVVAQIHSVIGS